MRTTIQQLEDLKEWSKDSTRYERRLAFRGNTPSYLAPREPAGTIPVEWDELSDREVEYYRTGPWSTREEYQKGQLVQPGPGRQGYRGEALTEQPFDVTKINLSEYEKKLIRDEFPELEFKFNKKQPIGIKAYKNHMNYKRVKDFIQRDFKTTVAFEPLSLGAQREIMREFTLPKGMEWNFEKYRYGISDGRAEGKGKYGSPQRTHKGTIHKGDRKLVRKIARFVSDPTKSETRYWGRKHSPGGFILSSVDRAVLQGNKNYKLKIKDGRVIGFVDKTVLDKNGNPIEFLYKGHGEERLKPGQKLITSHPQFKKIEKFYDVAFEATKSLDDTSRVFQKLFEGKGFNTANIRFTDLVRFLGDETTKGAVENAISKHHKKGVGTSPLKDLQIVTQVNNQFADDMAKKIRLGKLTVEDLEAINKRGVRFQVDGKWYGKDTGSTPKEQYKKVISEAIGDVKKWDTKKFKKFKIHVDKQLPNIIKGYQKAGIGGNCKAYGGRVGLAEAGAVNMSKCMTKAIEDNKKAMGSTDDSVRAAAIFKNRQAVNNAKKIPAIAKLIRQGIQKGKSSVGWLLGGWNIPLEAIVEGGIYEYYRRKGYTHDQAFAETFTPRLLKEGAEGKSTEDVPWYGGAEELLEKELYKIKGENEFMDVDNRPPMQDPEFGQVIGEREGVKRYIDNMAALDEVTSEYYKTQDHLAAAQSGRVKIDPDTIARLQIKLKELEAEGIRLNRLTKEGSSDWQLHQTQLEKQQYDQGMRSLEYGEWGQGDTPELARRREEERYRLMNEKFPGYHKGAMDKRLEDWGYYMNPNLRSYKGQTVQRPEGLKFIKGWTYDDFSDYLKDQDKMAYFAENFRTEKAGGGIANIRRPWAIPPESGPDPQGLASMNNYVTKRTG